METVPCEGMATRSPEGRKADALSKLAAVEANVSVASASPTDTVHLVPVNHTRNGSQVVLACELAFRVRGAPRPRSQGDYWVRWLPRPFELRKHPRDEVSDGGLAPACRNYGQQKCPAQDKRTAHDKQRGQADPSDGKR